MPLTKVVSVNPKFDTSRTTMQEQRKAKYFFLAEVKID